MTIDSNIAEYDKYQAMNNVETLEESNMNNFDRQE